MLTRKHFDLPSVLVIVITLLLFGLALVTGGLTHDLFLEAGVFLVSVKLILGSYRNRVVAKETRLRLEAIAEAVLRVEGKLDCQRGTHEDSEPLEAGSVM